MSHDRDITHRIVELAVRTRFEDLTPAAVAAARAFTLDSIGVALSGTRVPLGAALKETAATWGTGEAARIWGTGEPVPAASAA
ncbi:MAG: MmgE/PrpD family protein, partial [Gammaproteobacteria bacterium]